ncbi:MAG: hypothetical protein K2J71_06515 [Oscillospiraceae bacterium]|nr:hypothetical protein [Oscillospiraceae bacterium]
MKVIPVEVPGEFTTETRYVIINSDTGEVFDDAQGYGYRTSQKAYAAFNWKKKSPEEHAEQELKKKEVREWCKKHPSVVRQMEDVLFISVKERVPYTVQEILEVIPEEAKAEMTFTIKELLKYF